MTSRIILIGRNAAFPTLSGARFDRPALPDAARPPSSPTGRAAPSYDATAERWIVPPSGMTPDAGAAADLRSRCSEKLEDHSVSGFPYSKPHSPLPPPTAEGTLGDAVGTIAAFGALCVVAYALMVLA